MKIVGLTGGIGSGKSTVAKFFAQKGVPVYNADDEAKALMNRSKIIFRKLRALLGDEAYINGVLNRPYVAQQVFNNTKKLEQLNAIVHPKVAQHFKRWLKKQEGPYCIREAAILFESGSAKDCDYIILVTAPKEVRVNRVVQRDGANVAQVEARMQHQWSDEKKAKLASVSIKNIDLETTQKEVDKLHAFLSEV